MLAMSDSCRPPYGRAHDRFLDSSILSTKLLLDFDSI
ncbi:hypothetical protein PgNI_05588 [Pyricularia grisea]|uniref:Uncharacterized protein n=1 Tax=Pyricularia grisea TaxID=148305 RepID=A0A6P8B6X5_PYRGI|nr:hypothetical protein PgNI_05588 [Pyricularia grisea]TLD11066.1 hypothetical protein PgNI_05588 [Pyricularia grisea]